MRQLLFVILGVTLTIAFVTCWSFLGAITSEKAGYDWTTRQYIIRDLWYSHALHAPIVRHYLPGTFGGPYFDLDDNDVTATAVTGSVNNFSRINAEPGLGLSRTQGILTAGACGKEECWYIVDAGNGRCYLEGYSLQTGERIGWLGKDGLHRSEIPSGTSQLSLANNQADDRSILSLSSSGASIDTSGYHTVVVYINSGQDVYRVDCCGKQVELLYHSDSPILAFGYTKLLSEESVPNDGSIPFDVAIVTEKELTIFDKGKTVLRTITLPPPLQRQTLYVFLWKNLTSYIYAESEDVAHLFAFGPNDDIVWQRDINVADEPTPLPSFYAAFASVPVPIYWIYSHVSAVYYRPTFDPERVSARDIEELTRSDFWTGLIVLQISAAYLAALAYRRQRQHYLAKRWSIAWALLVLLAGPPAYLALLTYRYWPPREILLPPNALPESIELTGLEVIA